MANVVITGSTRGIGLYMAKEFLKAGCHVTISGRREVLPGETAKEISGFEAKTLYVPCNVQKKSDLEKLWDRSVEKWGSVDIWINNAGQNSPYEFSYNIASSYVEDLIDTNIKGVIYGSQIAAKHMLEQGGGKICNMEGLGSNDMIQPRTILYGTTKRALTYFTRALAKELSGTSVKAIRLSPGMMLTDFITKTPEGDDSPVLKDQKFRALFNILADKPETVAQYFVPKILGAIENDAQIAWLTKGKAFRRFMAAPFTKRKLI